jgi:hypothetical protein
MCATGRGSTPLSGEAATFWHFISEGLDEANRTVDLRRCERIRRPRPVIERFNEQAPTADSEVVWWRTTRASEERFVLALSDFAYVVVVADRGTYALPWTAYYVEHEHRRRKLRRDFEQYWLGRKS